MQQKGSDEEILQSFVSSLLMDEKEPVAPQKLVVNENPISQKIVTVPHKIKPVLSERLKLAQNLLKQMPKIQDVAEASRKLEDVKVDHKTAEQKANHPVENSSVNEMVKHQPHTINGNDENPPEFSSRPKIHKPEPFAIKVRVQPQVSPPLLKRETDILTPHTPIEPQLKIKPQVIEQITTKEIQQQQAKPVTQKRISKIPDWGRGRFQTLIFKVGEIKLAVPLVKLGGIHRLDPHLTQLAGQPEWYMGLMRDQVGNLSVIDTALWIMPDRYPLAKELSQDYEYVVLLDDTRWALAGGSVQDALMIREDEVNWTPENSKRPWLAGMLVEHMCALLDVDVLVDMLNKLSKKNNRS